MTAGPPYRKAFPGDVLSFAHVVALRHLEPWWPWDEAPTTMAYIGRPDGEGCSISFADTGWTP